MNRSDFSFNIENELKGLLLDVYLAQKLPQFSRSRLQKWLKAGHVHLDEKSARSAEKVEPGQTVRLAVPKEELNVLAESLPLEILYEDAKLLVVNKPAGMVTHPAQGNFTGTLANAVAHHCRVFGWAHCIAVPGAL